MQKIKPCAILISDVHYNINTLTLADAAMRQAIDKANDLQIPLIVAGDLHDTKANLRGECVNAMIQTFKLCKVKPYILRGNHDQINEKSQEHSLNFLAPYASIVTEMQRILSPLNSVVALPYQHSPELFKEKLSLLLPYQKLICHQGVNKANSGEYVQDKSAITTDDVVGRRVISGHYHTRQTIDLPDGGKWDYIGNPYSLNFAEANDPPKGFQILYDDGSLEFVPTNLRKHVVIEVQANGHSFSINSNQILPNKDDLVKVKAYGTKENLSFLDKKSLSNFLRNVPFKLDLIPTEVEEFKTPIKPLTNQELLDSIIDNSQTSDEGKSRIKNLWRGMV